MATPDSTSPRSISPEDRAAHLRRRNREIFAAWDQRRRIIEAPFLALGVNIYGRSYTWAGVLIEHDDNPGRRRTIQTADVTDTLSLDELIDMAAQ